MKPKVLLVSFALLAGCGSHEAAPSLLLSTATATPTAATATAATATAASTATATTMSSAPASAVLPDLSKVAFEKVVVCEKARCLRPAELVPSDPADAPAAPVVVDFGAKGTIRFEKNENVDVIVVALTGVVTVDVTTEVVPWVALLAPGGGIEVGAKGKGRALIVQTTSGDPLAAALAAAEPWRLQKARTLARFGEAADLVWQGGVMRARLVFEGPKASFGLLFVGPDQGVPQHTHDGSWEILVALAGGKRMAIAPQPGAALGEATPFTAGQVKAIRKATLHAGEPLRESPLTGATFVGFQLYVPAGPEQRFKVLGSGPSP